MNSEIPYLGISPLWYALKAHTFLETSRAYYKAFDPKEEDNYYRFSSEYRALNYFNACQDYAEEYSRNNNTVAGGN